MAKEKYVWGKGAEMLRRRRRQQKIVGGDAASYRATVDRLKQEAAAKGEVWDSLSTDEKIRRMRTAGALQTYSGPETLSPGMTKNADGTFTSEADADTQAYWQNKLAQEGAERKQRRQEESDARKGLVKGTTGFFEKVMSPIVRYGTQLERDFSSPQAFGKAVTNELTNPDSYLRMAAGMVNPEIRALNVGQKIVQRNVADRGEGLRRAFASPEGFSRAVRQQIEDPNSSSRMGAAAFLPGDIGRRIGYANTADSALRMFKGGAKLERRIKRHRAPSAWNRHVSQVYKNLKAEDPRATFADALKKAKSMYR